MVASNGASVAVDESVASGVSESTGSSRVAVSDDTEGENGSIGAGGLTGSGADGVIESIYSGSTGSTGSGFIGGTTGGFNGADGLSGFLEAGEDDSIGTSEPCSTVAVRVVGGLIPDFEIDAGAGAAIGVVVGGVGRSFLRTGDNSGVICEGGRGGGG